MKSLRSYLCGASVKIILVICMVLTLFPCSFAYGDTESDLAEAEARLTELGNELTSLQGTLASTTTELENTNYEIEQKEYEIEQTQAALDQKKTLLSDTMRSSYKQGNQTILDFVLDSSSLEDLASRVYYLDKASEQQATTIASIIQTKAELEQQKSDLETKQAELNTQVENLNAQVSEYEALVEEATAYYNELDAKLQEELAAKAAAEEAAAAAAQAALEAAKLQNQQQQIAQNNTSSNTSSTTTNTGTSSNTNTGSTGNIVAGGGLTTAYSLIGYPYVYGAAGPNSFDCSGLICYCYGYARGRSTYAMIASLKASGDWHTSLSELNVGDLVFSHSGHVGIYLGNNTYLHASDPTRGVIISTLYPFYGGGPY